jgi:hypothetical protein
MLDPIPVMPATPVPARTPLPPIPQRPNRVRRLLLFARPTATASFSHGCNCGEVLRSALCGSRAALRPERSGPGLQWIGEPICQVFRQSTRGIQGFASRYDGGMFGNERQRKISLINQSTERGWQRMADFDRDDCSRKLWETINLA